MGDAKVKQQPFYGAQSHHHHHHHHLHDPSASGTALKSTGGAASTASNMTTMAVLDSKHTNMGGGSPQQSTGNKESTMAATNAAGKDKSPASLKYEQLKLRKQELEKRLNEKYSQLQQIKREEAQLIGMYPSDFSCGIGPAGSSENGTGANGGTNGNGTAPTLRRKIGTSFKLPENLLNNKEDDINKLLLEKQIQQQISEASLRLANDSSQPKSVRRTHKQNYEMAQQNGIIPSGSQSMTQAASAAMISQLSMLRHRARTDSFPGIATNYDSTSTTGSAGGEQSLKMSPLSGSGSITSGGNINHQQLQHHHHHHQMGPGPARMNRLVQQQIGVNYSPPPPPTTPGYLLSPTTPSGNGAQAFVYDAKVISRLQANTSGMSGNANILHSPQGTATGSASSYLVNDQNYCPNGMVSATATSSGTGFEHGSHETLTVPSSGGLGGYWMTLESGEKVWCSVDSRQFSSLDRKQQGVQGGSMKLSRTSTKLSDRVKPSGQFTVGTAVKSSSLGNFQEAIGKSSSLDDNEMISVQPDAISVTSGSSEHKKREKVWRETSLDSPVVKHKTLPPVPPSQVGQMSPSSSGSGHFPQSPPYMQPVLGTNSSTAPLHINTNHHYHHSQQQQQLQSRLENSPPAPPQHLDLLPQSYAQQSFPDRGIPHHLSPSSSHHRMGQAAQDGGGYYPHRGQLSSRHPDLVISPTLSQSSSHTLTSATAVVQALPVVGGGLEENGTISPTPSMPAGGGGGGGGGGQVPSDIQLESPKNMTVVQQGKIMPYKENDLETNGSSSGSAGGDGIHKGIYQPPNRSICQPIANNYN
ncbi:AGAP008413-PA-like protein [Anopheles sinensis]|uniref:AGAP008413-PA-like protein n=1 Tax=Anopheles sinensis TaxID=74873 RepID=A0A084VMB8_ANOSI|nr:AGAP008413-PA-like protein [Anopheles sinensis]